MRHHFGVLYCQLFALLAFTESLPDTGYVIWAHRAHQSITIDGNFNDVDWSSPPEPGKIFVQEEPHPGEPALFPTGIMVRYNDQALYIAARLYDDDPEGILRELSERNTIGNADYFEVIIDPYADGVYGYSFVVTASGVQRDARIYNDSRDASWNAVWESAVQIDDEGWSVELRIPWAALRFPRGEMQEWQINFGRNIRRIRQQSWWHPVDPNRAGLLMQTGTLKGISNIRPPLRLSLFPFAALGKEFNQFTDHHPWSLSGGMDLKLGIGQAFTLDVTLIPDFSQTISDRDFLNLTPFEHEFDENRQFFTEGMEIFNRGSIFYSRRIGGSPRYRFNLSEQLEPGESIVYNPVLPQLINATKLSGKTGGGTGIGLINAVTAGIMATAEDESGVRREIPAVPATNYNMLVVEQSFGHQSTIALMNTHVYRGQKTPGSNVAGADFRLNSAGQIYSLRGSGHYSMVRNTAINDERSRGHQFHLEAGRISGRWRGSASYRQISTHFDPNDLGLLTLSNERRWIGGGGYYRYEPFSIFNRMNSHLNLHYTRLHSAADITGLRLEWNTMMFFKSWDFIYLTVQHSPIDVKDFFEPRTGRFDVFYLQRPRTYGSFYYSSDYRNPVAIDIRLSGTMFPGSSRNIFEILLEPRFRLSDRFSAFPSFRYLRFFHDEGFVAKNPDSQGFEQLESDAIVFGRRNRLVVENNLRLQYIFTHRMNAVVNLRHFYSNVDYDSFYTLQPNGKLASTVYSGRRSDGEKSLHDIVFHIFTLDLIYTWRFAPGSDLIFVWKNNMFSSNNRVPMTYFREFGQLASGPQHNTFVVKAIYYLDYNSIRQAVSSS